MKWSRILLVTVLVLATTSRIIPSLINNAVFSTDSWPLIRLTRLLVENPWIKVMSLSSRHAKWPSATLLSTVFVEVSGVSIYDFYAFLGAPLVVFTLALLLYVVLGGVFEELPRALSLLALLVYPSFTLFTSAYLKEVYAYPLAVLTLYLSMRTYKLSRWIGVLIASIALTLSHPLTSLIVIVYSLTLIYVDFVGELKNGVGGGVVYKWSLLATALLTSTLYTLHVFYAGPVYVFTLLDIVVLIAYTVFTYTTYLLIQGGGRGLGALALVVVLVTVVAYIGLVEGVPVGLSTIPYGLPLLLLLTGLLKPRGRDRGLTTPLLLPLCVGLLYTLTYAKWLASITHRFLNYLVYPIALSIGDLSRFKPRLAVLITVILVLNCYMVTYTASRGGDPILFYWRYSVVDVALKDFIEGYSNSRVLAGAKYSYMLGEDLAGTGLNLVTALRSCGLTGNQLLVTSHGELVYGVPITPLQYVKPRLDLFKCSSVVYSSLENYVLVD